MTEQQRQQLADLQKQIGDRGEDFVLRYERQRLYAHPRVNDVCIVGRKDVSRGYDILSFIGPASTTPDRYIEVKTYTTTPHFFLSASEQAAAHRYGTNYFLYLVDLSEVAKPGYQPLILQDPISNLNEQWHEKVQSREFIFSGAALQHIPQDLDSSTILIGCFTSNDHLNWILRSHSYNVRQGIINGSVASNEMTSAPEFLLLYSVRDPRTYRLYDISGVSTATREEMCAKGYPNPHASRYILYHLRSRLETIPIDIMALLATYNDKNVRSSGMPIYLSGGVLRKYLLGGPSPQGIAPKRIFSNEGKPWTEANRSMLAALYQTGTSIPALAHTLKRNVEEIKAQLHHLGLL